MDNDRFVQNLDELIPSTLDIDSSGNKNREFLKIGTRVELKTGNYGDIEIIALLGLNKDIMYDYVGKFVDSDGKIKRIYFDEGNIQSVHKSEEKVK